MLAVIVIKVGDSLITIRFMKENTLILHDKARTNLVIVVCAGNKIIFSQEKLIMETE